MIEKIKDNEHLAEFIRFCIVGAISAGIDAAVFYATNIFCSYQVALVLGYLTGLSFNYILTIYWTFKQKPSAKNAIGVIVAHLINLFIIRIGLMWIFVTLMCIDEKIAYLPTIFISVIANYLMVRFAVTITSR